MWSMDTWHNKRSSRPASPYHDHFPVPPWVPPMRKQKAPVLPKGSAVVGGHGEEGAGVVMKLCNFCWFASQWFRMKKDTKTERWLLFAPLHISPFITFLGIPSMGTVYLPSGFEEDSGSSAGSSSTVPWLRNAPARSAESHDTSSSGTGYLNQET